MAVRDQVNNTDYKVAIPPTVLVDGTTLTSGAIDTLGFESVTFGTILGTLVDVDATWTMTIKEGATNVQAAHTIVTDEFLIGTAALAGFTFADDNKCKKVGYKGGQRYVSCVITNIVANLSAAPVAVFCALGHPKTRPTANPPA